MNYDIFADYYDDFIVDFDYDLYADYIENTLKKYDKTKGITLDLGTGTGNLAIKLAQRNFDMIAVDSSALMLSEAQQKAAKNGLNILFLRQNMTKLDLYGTITLAVSSLDCINHLNSENDVFKAFSKVSLFMEKGSLFIFDLNTLYKHHKILANNTIIKENDNSFLAWSNTLNGDKVSMNLDIFNKTHENLYDRNSFTIEETAYSVDFITDSLKKAGFSEVNIYSFLTYEKLQETDARMSVIAIK